MSTKQKKSHPDRIDVYVGARIRERRTVMGLSQTDLGKSLGISFQQIQKYERGSNRVSCSKLWRFASALGVGIPFFFEGMPKKVPKGKPLAATEMANNDLVKRETLELVRNYYKITSQPVRDMIRKNASVLAGEMP